MKSEADLIKFITDSAVAQFGDTVDHVKVRDCRRGNPFVCVYIQFFNSGDFIPTISHIRRWRQDLKKSLLEYFPEGTKALSLWNESFQSYQMCHVDFSIGEKGILSREEELCEPV